MLSYRKSYHWIVCLLKFFVKLSLFCHLLVGVSHRLRLPQQDLRLHFFDVAVVD